MTEPASTTVGGVILYKVASPFVFTVLAVFVVLATIVVMAMTLPGTRREFVVCMICTVVGSVGGGSFVVRWLEIHHWADELFGLVGMGGVFFACALPGWLTVRAYFKYAEMRKDKSIIEIIAEIKQAIRA